jgi:hypothetical protein
MNEAPVFFQSEVQLAGWSESHTSGCKVTFFLPDAADLDAFRALTVRKGMQAGQRMACVLVLIGDDEKPEQPPAPMPRAAAEPAPEPLKGGPLAQLAGRWTNDPQFCRFLSLEYPQHGIPHSSADAANIVRILCEVDSRVELDHDPEAAKRFQTLIRIPYMQWLHEQRR